MVFEQGYIAVDWGSTHRRVFAVGADGVVADRYGDDRGVLTLAVDAFAGEVAALHARFGERPMLLAGMIGSDRGWCDAGYVDCPAGLVDVARALRWVEPRIAIVPGVAQRTPGADVMRGEEVQVLGAGAGGLARGDGVLCHPGTHTKWIAVADARIVQFCTMMTGELFALLRTHSILRAQLHDPVIDDVAFRRGARDGLQGDCLSRLFTIRAAALLGVARLDASYASGLLIGEDVRAGRAVAGGPVTLVGDPVLCALYAAVLDEAGQANVPIIDGEQAFLAGIAAIVAAL